MEGLAATARVVPHAPAELPQVGRPPWWLGAVACGTWLVWGLGDEPDWAPQPWRALWFLVIAVAYGGRALDESRFTVVTDGLTVEVKRRFGSTRFPVAAVTSVVLPTFGTAGAVRVRRPERRLGRVRLPNIVPWPAAVRTYVPAWTWVHELGVPEGRTRRAWPFRRRRGLPSPPLPLTTQTD